MDPMTLWKISWAVGALVVVIVAVLLLIIIAAARSIDRRANEIWIAGKQIAANTVSIWMLQKTNAVAGEILSVAKQIAAGAGAIDAKLSELARGGR
jgi:hypothetical protein